MTPEQMQASHERTMDRAGESVTLVRSDDQRIYQARAKLKGPFSADPTGTAQQGRLMALVLASDLQKAEFPLPIQTNRDRLKWGDPSRTSAITDVDEVTHRTEGVTVSYLLELEG